MMIFRFKYDSYVLSVRCGSELISGPHFFVDRCVDSHIMNAGEARFIFSPEKAHRDKKNTDKRQ